MTSLLNDEELREELKESISMSVYRSKYHNLSNLAQEMVDDTLSAVIPIITTQKRLYAESVKNKGNKKLKAIYEIVSGDWGYSVTDDMVDLHTGNYKEFTQKQAEEMAIAIGRVYMIAHTINCGACDSKWRIR